MERDMVKSIIQIYAIRLMVFAVLVPLALVAHDHQIANLDIYAQSEKITYQPRGKGLNCFGPAAVTLAQSQNTQQCVEALLGVRYDATRLHSNDEYTLFAGYAVHTALRVMVDEVMDMLDPVAESIRYWQYQRAHPIYYFLHKNPMKYVSGSSQADEVQEHLTALQTVQKIYFAHLGSLTEQMRVLSQLAGSAVDRQKQLMQVTQTLAQMVNTTSNSVTQPITSDTILDTTITVLSHIPLHTKRTARELELHGEPSGLHQYGLVAGVMAVGMYGLHKAVSSKADTLDGAWQKNKADLVTRVNNTFAYCDQ